MVKPPRALWVPFPLGRPYGVADNADFQRDVLHSALRLLETATGPSIEDYPHDAPGVAELGVWACPVSFESPDTTETEKRLLQEVQQFQPWWDEGHRTRGRTGIGTSGAGPDDLEKMVALLAAVVEGADPFELPEAAEGPPWSRKMPVLMNYVVDDLRAFYQEAVTAKPGKADPDHNALNRWFFTETVFGETLTKLANRLTEIGDPRLIALRGFFIPEGHFKGGVTWGDIPDDIREFVKSMADIMEYFGRAD